MQKDAQLIIKNKFIAHILLLDIISESKLYPVKISEVILI